MQITSIFCFLSFLEELDYNSIHQGNSDICQLNDCVKNQGKRGCLGIKRYRSSSFICFSKRRKMSLCWKIKIGDLIVKEIKLDS